MSAASALVDHLECVIEAKSIEDVWSLHLAKMEEYGFPRLLYGFTRFRTSNSFGSVDDVLVLSNHPEEYLAAFVQSGAYAQAPMVKWAAAHEGACSWRLIGEVAASGQLTPAQKRILELNDRFGVRAGYSISFRDVSVRAKGRSASAPGRGCASTRSTRSGPSTAARSSRSTTSPICGSPRCPSPRRAGR